ncbi:hypothetical protein CLOSYM_01311 [[Clostridium] symbiosum ATCC 14940]|uniref:Uncharacterized protein n=1 Tax=[Clostridium] symbiosum ATCC 14940 TaxID=411472 RepID=A0ABC9U0Q4_CLOSY|nr:hypothetical protein CLOSYM_01311 [[Clostridium] symbiosum ATCC 14940]
MIHLPLRKKEYCKGSAVLRQVNPSYQKKLFLCSTVYPAAYNKEIPPFLIKCLSNSTRYYSVINATLY